MLFYGFIINFFMLLITRSSADICFNTFPVWTSNNGQLLLNGQYWFHLKGISWFGAESEIRAPHYLWNKPVSYFLDILVSNQFNAVRLPLSVDLVLDNPIVDQSICHPNPNLCGKQALDVLEFIIDRLADRGILVMLDQHVLKQGTTGITELWYDSFYSETDIIRFWTVLLNRFASKWNVFAVDLKNEPHGVATWGNNNLTTNWNKAAERIINAIGQNTPNYKGLFFVEGVEANENLRPSEAGHFWGEALEGTRDFPIRTGHSQLDDRVVYSPHVYGPDVYNQNYFNDPRFPQNMPAIWDVHFGFVKQATGRAVVVGEWGGRYAIGSKDHTWQNAFGDYLTSQCMSDTFYWCLNPNSGDTGGFLDDQLNVVLAKAQLLTGIQPSPSRLYKNGNDYCFNAGSSANPNCGDSTTPAIQSTVTRSTAPTSTPTQMSTVNPVSPLQIQPFKTSDWLEHNVQHNLYEVRVTNSGSRKICNLRIKMMPLSTVITQMWNMQSVDQQAMEFEFPNWFQVSPSQTRNEAGVVIRGNSVITFNVKNFDYC